MAETDEIGMPKFNLQGIDIEALEALRSKIFVAAMNQEDEARFKELEQLFSFYNSVVNGYYLGKQLNAGIPLLNCKVEKK